MAITEIDSSIKIQISYPTTALGPDGVRRSSNPVLVVVEDKEQNSAIVSGVDLAFEVIQKRDGQTHFDHSKLPEIVQIL